MTRPSTAVLSPEDRKVIRRFRNGELTGDEARAELGMPAIPRGPLRNSHVKAA